MSRRTEVCWCFHGEYEHNADGCSRCKYGTRTLFNWVHRYRPIGELKTMPWSRRR